MKPYKESILIVDDSYDLLEVLQRQLQANGYHTYQASNVVDAIDVLKGSHVDLLITDMQSLDSRIAVGKVCSGTFS